MLGADGDHILVVGGEGLEKIFVTSRDRQLRPVPEVEGLNYDLANLRDQQKLICALWVYYFYLAHPVCQCVYKL